MESPGKSRAALGSLIPRRWFQLNWPRALIGLVRRAMRGRVMIGDASKLSSPVLSDELRVMRHPIKAYRELTAQDVSATFRKRLIRGPLLWALSLGVFISFTTAGRLTWSHLIIAPIAWSFYPFWGMVWTIICSRKAPRRLPISRRLDLYFKSFGPFYVSIVLWSAVCVFTPHTRVFIAEWAFLLVPIQLGLFGWSALTTWGMYRAGLEYSRSGALWRTAGYYAGVFGSILTYYLLAGQLIPILVPPS